MRLRKQEPIASSISTIGRSVEQLDLAMVIKVSEAVSGEMVLEKVIDTLMRTATEHGGAERGLLILLRGDEQRIEGTRDDQKRIPVIFILLVATKSCDCKLSRGAVEFPIKPFDDEALLDSVRAARET